MKIDDKNYEDMRRLVEEVSGRKMLTPRDFNFLLIRIYDRTHLQISASTLKRFWGYVSKDDSSRGELRPSTLNILARYVGYSSWEAFCNRDVADDSECSNPFYGRQTLCASDLEVGEIVELIWDPNRLVRIRYSGNNVFMVVESRNSKLSVNDTFTCAFFVENLPLTLINLIHDGGEPSTYMCGKRGGVTFNRIGRP